MVMKKQPSQDLVDEGKKERILPTKKQKPPLPKTGRLIIQLTTRETHTDISTYASTGTHGV